VGFGSERLYQQICHFFKDQFSVGIEREKGGKYNLKWRETSLFLFSFPFLFLFLGKGANIHHPRCGVFGKKKNKKNTWRQAICNPSQTAAVRRGKVFPRKLVSLYLKVGLSPLLIFYAFLIFSIAL